jgi:hypothetical protein
MARCKEVTPAVETEFLFVTFYEDDVSSFLLRLLKNSVGRIVSWYFAANFTEIL